MIEDPINLTDIVSGRTGTVYITIDGSRELAAYLKDMTCDISIENNEGGGLGHIIKQSKPGQQTVTVSGNAYQMTSTFANIADTHRRTGKMPEIEIMVTLEDPQSDAGVQTLVLKKLVMTKCTAFVVDDAEDKPTHSLEFSCGDYELSEKFTVLPQFSA